MTLLSNLTGANKYASLRSGISTAVPILEMVQTVMLFLQSVRLRNHFASSIILVSPVTMFRVVKYLSQ